MLGDQEIRDCRDWMGTQVQAANLWPGGTGAVVELRPYDYRFDIRSADVPPASVHRRFQVRVLGSARDGGKAAYVAGAYQHVRVGFLLRIAYFMGGGDKANISETEAQAIQDAEAVRQWLEHPENVRRDNAGNRLNPISMDWEGTVLAQDGERLYSENTFRALLQVTVERAAWRAT